MPNMMLTALTAGVSSIGSVMDNGMSMGERLSYGLRMTAVGMLMVFAVLGIICLAVLLLRLIFFRGGKAAEAVPEPDTVSDGTPDPELVAVLTAAVAAILAEEAEASGEKVPSFRVVSFGRANRGWNEKK